jgi:hypothetical protein
MYTILIGKTYKFMRSGRDSLILAEEPVHGNRSVLRATSTYEQGLSKGVVMYKRGGKGSGAAAICGMAMVLASLVTPSSGQGGLDAIRATGVETGFCVHVGTVDGAVEAGLTNDGKVLVQGLTTEPDAVVAARSALAGKGQGSLSVGERHTGA